MQALKYENLLKQIYRCDKDFSKGIDASFYDNMEKLLNDIVYGSQTREKELAFRKAFMDLCRYLDNALTEGMMKIQDTASTQTMKELNDMQTFLAWPFYNRIKLDEVIERAGILFKENGLFV